MTTLRWFAPCGNDIARLAGHVLARVPSALSVSIGLGGSVLRPLLTSVRTTRSYPRSPRLSGQPYSRVRAQISPNKSVNFRCTSSPSTVEPVGNGFVVHRQLASGSLLAYMAFLFVASQLWRERCRLLRRSRVRRLPSHGSSPPRSCLRLVLCRSELHLVYCLLEIPVFVQGTCTPQVHAHVGRTMHARRRLRPG